MCSNKPALYFGARGYFFFQDLCQMLSALAVADQQEWPGLILSCGQKRAKCILNVRERKVVVAVYKAGEVHRSQLLVDGRPDRAHRAVRCSLRLYHEILLIICI